MNEGPRAGTAVSFVFCFVLISFVFIFLSFGDISVRRVWSHHVAYFGERQGAA